MSAVAPVAMNVNISRKCMALLGAACAMVVGCPVNVCGHVTWDFHFASNKQCNFHLDVTASTLFLS